MPPRLGEILVQDGACTPEAVREALKNQVIFGGRLGTNLLELHAVTEEALAGALARRHGCPALSGELKLDARAVALVKPELADRHEVIPYLLADRRLAVLAADPGDLAMLDEVAFATGRQVHAIVAPEARIWALLRSAYGIDRHLRGIDVDFGSVRDRPREGPAAAPAAARPAGGGDLMDEAEFDAIYGKTASYGLDPAAPPAPAAPRAGPAAEGRPGPGGGPPVAPRVAPPAAPPPPAPDDDVVVELGEEWIEPVPAAPAATSAAADVLAALARSAGHAPPARYAPAATARAEEPEPSPLGFADAVRFLEGVGERDAIARTVLRYARTRFRRAVLLTVNRGAAQGWAGLGEKLGREAVRRIRLPLGAPGVVDTVVTTRAHFLGPIPKTESNVRLLKQLGGGVPGNAFLVPILALGRVVNVFYADNGRGAVVDASDLGELLILATRIAKSYDALLAQVR